MKDIERLKEEGNIVLKGAKWEEAVKLYSEAIKQVGEKEEEGRVSFKALHTHAHIYFHLEKYDAPTANFTSAIENTSSDTDDFVHVHS
ncbi:hypothetical protein BDQ17DRAFT_1425624 [Cyathus striatus]|nr:hypothetical protein BDQ17DRAFT_1425624 [Cyathus striatus]